MIRMIFYILCNVCNVCYVKYNQPITTSTSNSSCCLLHSFQTRCCTTPQQRCGRTHTSPRATTASLPPMPGSRSTTIRQSWRLPPSAPTSRGPTGMTGRLGSCRSSSRSSSWLSSSRINCNSCSRSNRSSTTSNSSSCSISSNRWSPTSLSARRKRDNRWEDWSLECEHVYFYS